MGMCSVIYYTFMYSTRLVQWLECDNAYQHTHTLQYRAYVQTVCTCARKTVISCCFPVFKLHKINFKVTHTQEKKYTWIRIYYYALH